MKLSRRQFGQILLASSINAIFVNPGSARPPRFKQTSMSEQDVVYPPLCRIGLIPPPNLVPANLNQSLSMFIGGVYGFSDFIQLVFIPIEQFDEI